jgi:sodium/proline symporter
MFDIYEILPAFIFALLVEVIVSLLTPPPSQDIVEQFDSIKK